MKLAYLRMQASQFPVCNCGLSLESSHSQIANWNWKSLLSDDGPACLQQPVSLVNQLFVYQPRFGREPVGPGWTFSVYMQHFVAMRHQPV